MDDDAVADERADDAGAGADRAVAADAHIGADHRLRADHAAGADLGARADDGAGVDDHARLEPRRRDARPRRARRRSPTNSDCGRSASGNSTRHDPGHRLLRLRRHQRDDAAAAERQDRGARNEAGGGAAEAQRLGIASADHRRRDRRDGRDRARATPTMIGARRPAPAAEPRADDLGDLRQRHGSVETEKSARAHPRSSRIVTPGRGRAKSRKGRAARGGPSGARDENDPRAAGLGRSGILQILVLGGCARQPTASEIRAAGEAEPLRHVAIGLGQHHRIVEADRPERRLPQRRGADRGADLRLVAGDDDARALAIGRRRIGIDARQVRDADTAIG